MCESLHVAVKMYINYSFLHLLSILLIDPALDNAHPHCHPRSTWNYNTKNVFQNEHSVLR